MKILISRSDIAERIAELAAEINRDYFGKELVVVGILKGSFIFLADLVRELKIPITCEFLATSSYGDQKSSSGEVKLNLDIRTPLAGKHVLIVEDIVDSGLTLKFIMELLQVRGLASIKCCTLLQKPECLKTDIIVDYVGFKIKNEFVVGYGLDYAQRFRELPDIAILE